MAELKTKKTKNSVAAFIANISDEQRSDDCKKLLIIFKEVTKEKPAMWGSAIVGFGSYHYKSERSSQEGDWMLTGFSPRKQALTLYIMSGFVAHEDLMKKLGTYKRGVCCIYIKKLSDINIPVLKQLIRKSVAQVKKRYAK